MHILSFDIEDWFHVLDNQETANVARWETFPSRLEEGLLKILDMCDRTHCIGTFFILGWVAKMRPDLVAEIKRRGHEIACHSDHHQLVYTQSPAEFEADLRDALDAIEAACGTRPTAYRAPGFSITQECVWAFDIMAKLGIKTDCSIFPASRSHGGLPVFPAGCPCKIETESGTDLRCFPISYQQLGSKRIVFSGGGYFRLFPYALLRAAFAANPYVMTYFHPRDFDPDQPMIPGLSRMRRFKSYVGLSKAMGKLEKIIKGSDFISLREAETRVDWDNAVLIHISNAGEIRLAE